MYTNHDKVMAVLSLPANTKFSSISRKFVCELMLSSFLVQEHEPGEEVTLPLHDGAVCEHENNGDFGTNRR